MGHSFTSSLYHVVFSTKGREKWITSDYQERVWPYLGGIARENKITAMSIGGMADHVHILLSLPSTMAIAKAVQLIKGGSSKWIHESFPRMRGFQWQEGYGAFSIGISDVQRTRKYIENQAEHHRHRTFQEELIEILKKHGMDWQKPHIWD